ncbi:hybrid sensor histidine kinase/response regulator [Pelagicoccus sp. SDUM812002]|uniref:hybrid sensor histidine kinase/response regulator n=1 Tax=Pelagicoccus sp. SDUM812002 TaxID=3041266 RepID=UPI00280CE0B9|nr:hybrid sensor histidine kinase/response regulator [Pelagicoccus sp. SDUM812002]MDQ8186328.1 hybrid sensor histidine kinase/response regulator [Pelagicoccus sp. SDUM812002]
MNSQLPNSTEPESDLGKVPEVRSGLVLVVDDDRITHGIAKKILTAGDFETLHAYDAKQAKQLISKSPPELIICDVEMPGEGGIALCRELKSQASTSEIPLIFVTGSSHMETMNQAFDAGANDYLQKPIRKTELLTRARRQIADFRKRRDTTATINNLHRQNTSKTKFLGVASHDLRNPIASISGVSHFLETERFGKLNDSQREMVRCIIEASENMLNLVEDLLDVSKIDLDNFDLSREQLAPRDIMAQTAKMQTPTAEKKAITLVHTDHSDGALASIDKRLITRAVENLVSNAIKFSPKGTRVQIETRTDSKSVYMSVKDEGPGIPKDEFNKLFKEFSRTSNMPTAGESTSGIGLYVVKRIVNSHDGEITVENLPEGGAHFQIQLNRIP